MQSVKHYTGFSTAHFCSTLIKPTCHMFTQNFKG